MQSVCVVVHIFVNLIICDILLNIVHVFLGLLFTRSVCILWSDFGGADNGVIVVRDTIVVDRVAYVNYAFRI